MYRILSIFCIFMVCISCSSPMKKLVTVPEVDLNRYMGKWYEIARLPNSFEKGLICCTAEYSLLTDGKVEVVNSGHKEEDPERTSKIKGKAWVPDAGEPGRLKVRFFWPFTGGYYIFHLDPDYQFVLVGSPSRKYLWILARTSTLDEPLYQELVRICGENDFDTENLIRVRQDCF